MIVFLHSTNALFSGILGVYEPDRAGDAFNRGNKVVVSFKLKTGEKYFELVAIDLQAV